METLATHDGLRLAVEDHVAPKVKAHVLIVHGFGEHKGRYGHVVTALQAGRYACHLFDLRGHGASQGPRADVAKFDDFRQDLVTVIRHVRRLAAPAADGGTAPLMLLGHSMGGLIALDGVVQHPSTFAGVIASSPFVAPAGGVSGAERVVARLLGRLAPTLRLPARLEARWLSHDPAVVDAYVHDPLVVSRMTFRLWREIERAQRGLLQRAGEISLPALFLVGTDDRVVDVGAIHEVFRRLRSADKSRHTYDGFFHEVLNEAGRDRVLADLRRWLDARVPG